MPQSATVSSQPYTGFERPISESEIAEPHIGDYFQVKPRDRLPVGVVPIFDNQNHAIIGYLGQFVGGVARIYDLDGRQISLQELPLETPLIDPIDLIFILGSLARVVSRGLLRAGAELAGDAMGKTAARGVSAASVSLLRLVFRQLTERELQFTATTAERMADPGRFVPIHILKLAVRYGSREPDTKGIAGAFRYTVKMLRAPKNIGGLPREYTLRVVVLESDWTVLHFHYE
jgi:hypothetical protein